MGKVAIAVLLVVTCLFAAWAARGAELQVPERVPAGAGLTIGTSGSGDVTFYLIGPTRVLKRKVRLGESIQVAPEDVQSAGRYTVILNQGSESTSASFWVDPAQPARVSFLARPSRLPVAITNGISGTLFPFDKFHNLIVRPEQVTFRLAVGDAPPLTRSITTRDGIAWTSMDSSRKAGSAQFTATIGDVTERRVVQQVPSDPCNLRMHVQRSKDNLEVETDPIRDCTGNPVPDGTIVTFTENSPAGRSSVDARIKRGIAKAELPATQGAVLSVASGVVMGNEIRLGGGQ